MLLRFPFIKSKELLAEFRHYEDYYKNKLDSNERASSQQHNINLAIDRYFKEMKDVDFPQTRDRMARLRTSNDTHSRQISIDVYADLKTARETFEDELNKHNFIYIPKDRQHFINNPNLFGVEVSENFPSIKVELENAGNCYASDNHTACVFHLMRAVEIGGKALLSFMKATKHLSRAKGGTKPKPISLCTWGDLKNAMKKALDEQHSLAITSPQKKAKYQFCNEAVETFGHFQHAWRDKVSHSNVIYDKYYAQKIISSTERFLKHLATKIEETK